MCASFLKHVRACVRPTCSSDQYACTYAGAVRTLQQTDAERLYANRVTTRIGVNRITPRTPNEVVTMDT